MNKVWLVLVLLASGVICIDYEQQGENWGGECEIGKLQSPININTTNVQNSTSQYSIEFNYHDWNVVKVNNNQPNYWQFLSPVHNKCTLTLTVNDDQITSPDCTSATYNLDKIHFHTMSEHQIDSKQYEVQVHLSHAITLESKSCRNFQNHLQLAILFQSNILDFKPNIFIFQLNLEQYAKQRNKRFDSQDLQRQLSDPYYPAQVSGKAILERYIPDVFMQHGYYLYLGSRSQPDCLQDYIWIVSPHVFTIPRSQYLVFKNNMNNPSYRAVKPINGRTVHFSQAVTSAGLWSLSVSLVSLAGLILLTVNV